MGLKALQKRIHRSSQRLLKSDQDGIEIYFTLRRRDEGQFWLKSDQDGIEIIKVGKFPEGVFEFLLKSDQDGIERLLAGVVRRALLIVKIRPRWD